MSTTVSIRLRRDTAANWTSANPILAEGQPGYDTTNRILKVGDGVTAWNSLNQIAADALIPDADYGDVTVSSAGTVISIDNDAVTFAKMQNIAASRLLGRATAGSGDVEELNVGRGLALSGATLVGADSLDGLSDVTLTSPTTGDVLTYNGSAWVNDAPSGGGAGFGRADTAPPVVSSWTWFNQGSATATDRTYGGSTGISVLVPAGGASDNLRGLVRSTPSTPYNIIARLRRATMAKNFHLAGMVWRENSTGRLHSLHQLGNGTLESIRWTNATTSSGVNDLSLTTAAATQYEWMRFADDGTTKTMAVSPDGYEWVTVVSLARATFFTPDEVGFFANAYNAATPNLDIALGLMSWEVA